MGYMTGVGIGGVLAQLPQGIYQGQEIQRRRTREDDAQAMAKAEFENRQAIFGRQQHEWGQQDLERQVNGDLQADIIDKAEAYKRLSEGGAGDAALRMRGAMTQLDLGEQNLIQGKQMFDANLEAHRANMDSIYGAKRDRDMVRAWVLGDYGSLKDAFQSKANSDDNHFGSTVQDVSPVLDRSGRPVKGPDGLTQVQIKALDPSGKPVTHTINVAQMGAFLNAPGLQTLAAQEQQSHMWNTQMGMAAADRRDMKAKDMYMTTLAQKQAEAKPYQDEFDKYMRQHEIASKAYYDKVGMSSHGVEDEGAKKLKSEMDGIETQVALARSKRDAAIHGYKWDEVPGTDGKSVDVDIKRSIIPYGTKDPHYKLDWRPKDNAMYANTGNVTRLLSMTTPRAEGEDDTAYKNRLEAKVKADGLGAGWYALMAPKDGSKSPVLVPVGANTRTMTAPQKERIADGWTSVNPPGMNFGDGMTADVEEGMRLQDQFTTAAKGVSASAGRGGAGRAPSGGRGNGVLPMAPGMRSR